jgi:ribosomal protein L6P/L9E
MAERNSKWGAMDECFVFFLRESMDPTMRSLVNNFVLGTEEYFTERTKTGQLGFAIEKLQNGKFNLYHMLDLMLISCVLV